MLLEDKTAVIFGGGGSMGGAIARAFAREGATVFLARRTQKMQAVADDIPRTGGIVEAATVDAHDPTAGDAYLARIIDKAGRLDVSVNTVNPNDQGVPLVDMPVHDFLTPVTESARTNFVTATASALAT